MLVVLLAVVRGVDNIARSPCENRRDILETKTGKKTAETRNALFVAVQALVVKYVFAPGNAELVAEKAPLGKMGVDEGIRVCDNRWEKNQNLKCYYRTLSA